MFGRGVPDAGLVAVPVDAVVVDRDRLLGNAVRGELLARRLRDHDERLAPVEQAKRRRLEHHRDRRAQPAELLGVVAAAVDVVHHREPRCLQPQRREERDPIDHLEDDVRIGHEAARLAHDRSRPDGRAAADAVKRQRTVALDRLRARIAARDHAHPMTPVEPMANLEQKVRARTAGLGMRPVAVGQDQDVESVSAAPARHRKEFPPFDFGQRLDTLSGPLVTNK